MNSRLTPLANLVRLHTDLVRNSLSGVSNDHARARPLTGCNSMAFITAHLVDARFYLCATLGSSEKSPLSGILDDAGSIEDVLDLPPIDEISRLWIASESHVLGEFENATAELLGTPSGNAFPTEDHTTLGVATFLVHHEAYHLGQLGLLRKGLGYGPMSYERR